jgi:hypothetical protein
VGLASKAPLSLQRFNAPAVAKQLIPAGVEFVSARPFAEYNVVAISITVRMILREP